LGISFRINNQIIINQTFSSSLAVCAKKQFYLQNERKTNSRWFAIAIDNVKNRTALFMELLGG
jgi:hypothetical protein